MFGLVSLLFRNTGLEVEMGENKVISSVVLEAEDKDTPRFELNYIINSVPTFGQLQLKVKPETIFQDIPICYTWKEFREELIPGFKSLHHTGTVIILFRKAKLINHS